MIEAAHTPVESSSVPPEVGAALDAIRDGRPVVVVDPPAPAAWLALAAQFVTPQGIELLRDLGEGPISLCLGRGTRAGAAGGGGLGGVGAADQAAVAPAELARAVQSVLVPRPDERPPTGIVALPVARAARHGVLGHAGPVEAAVDLARLAEVIPAAAICRARADRDRRRLPRVAIRDVIRHRTLTEGGVEKVAEARLPTRFGVFLAVGFEERLTGRHHLALVNGDVRSPDGVLVAVHSRCLAGDVLRSVACECSAALDSAMARVAAEAPGVLLYLSPAASAPGAAGMRFCSADALLGPGQQVIAARLLAQLGVTAARLVTPGGSGEELGRELGVRVVEPPLPGGGERG
jgi:3,4-dihydroxy 2-butanone 4-phosphate synthase/GTP cyclohydrolase II